MATIQDLEDWLIAIAQHTRETKEVLEGRGGAAKESERKQESMFERLGKRLENAIAGTVANRVGQAQALAQREFSGTVEGARYDYAMEQVSRQFAAVFKPIMDGFTYAAVQLERRMRMMDGGEQNRLMGGIVGAGVGLRYGGVPGAFFGGAVGAAMMGGGNSTTAIVAAAGGAALGYRTAGPIGAVVGAGVGLATASPRRYQEETMREYYDRQRAAGATRFGAETTLHGDTIRRLFESPPPGRPPKPGTNEPRRDVTPFQAQMTDAGETHFRIQEAMIRATAGADFQDGGPFKPVIDAVLNKLDELIRAVGGSVPSPRSAAEQRQG